ncbi:MAG: hypothetical protein GY801_01130 [bacterium]|nr:hypothetical protein [bacterium]
MYQAVSEVSFQTLRFGVKDESYSEGFQHGLNRVIPLLRIGQRPGDASLFPNQHIFSFNLTSKFRDLEFLDRITRIMWSQYPEY